MQSVQKFCSHSLFLSKFLESLCHQYKVDIEKEEDQI